MIDLLTYFRMDLFLLVVKTVGSQHGIRVVERLPTA